MTFLFYLSLMNVSRLGKLDENQQNKIRPLKKTFEKESMRNDILKNVNKLKDMTDEPFKKVQLKM